MPRVINKYQIESDAPHTDLECELLAFRWKLTPETHGLGRYSHFKNAASIWLPNLEWHPWLERGIDTLCENQYVGFAGCAASSKTFLTTFYGLQWWLSAPYCSTVILTSTTAKMIRKRAWPVLQSLYRSCKGFPGHMVDSKTTLQCRKGDDLNAIFAIAVAEGETRKAVAQIQGIHNKRILVVIDEAEDSPDAIFEVCANLESGADDFQLVACANPISRFSRFGRFCEPVNGWPSIAVEDEEWETRMENGKKGICVRFDGEKSPNVLAGKNQWPYLITIEKVEADKRNYGASSPLYWKWTRGFWAPEGLTKTVFSESAIIKHEGRSQFIFTGKTVFTIAFCDPAFGGGDRPVLRFAKVGDIEGGRIVIQLGRTVILPLDANSTNPIHYQLAEQIVRECEKEKCEPQNFGLDASGEGGGLADILARTWSSRIERVEFGGRPSDLPVSNEDVRLCSDVYDRKVTELWFTAREFLLSGQLRGLDTEAISELTKREFSDEKRKIRLQTKDEMKKVYNRSPDLADAVVGVCEVAKRRGVLVNKVGETAKVEDEWQEQVKQLGKVFEEETMYQPDTELEEAVW